MLWSLPWLRAAARKAPRNLIWICTARYWGIRINAKFQFELVPRDIEEFEFLDFGWLTKISPPSRISICIPMTISSLIFSGTGCSESRNGVFWHSPYVQIGHDLFKGQHIRGLMCTRGHALASIKMIDTHALRHTRYACVTTHYKRRMLRDVIPTTLAHCNM